MSCCAWSTSALTITGCECPRLTVAGPPTLLGFHRALLEHPCFVAGETCHGVVDSEGLAARGHDVGVVVLFGGSHRFRQGGVSYVFVPAPAGVRGKRKRKALGQSMIE